MYCFIVSDTAVPDHRRGKAKKEHPEGCSCAPQVGLEPTTTRLTAECSAIELLRNIESGSDLISRAVSSQVPSALESLTSVFGMGTGGTSPSLPPEIVNLFGAAAARLLSLTHRFGFFTAP